MLEKTLGQVKLDTNRVCLAMTKELKRFFKHKFPMTELKFIMEFSKLSEGMMMGVKADNVDVLVANLKGEIVALSNKCTHRGCLLSNGKLIGVIVQCPCHGAKFDLLTGEVKAGPAVKPLKKYEVVVEEGKVYLKM
ncbi:MAG: Rieske (2Fe-2S) protein [Thermoproteota archaeon]